ncbi:MAG: LamG domain-containing protein [Verrucomicrobiaceae bacterium]|nr:MAG: LamG domain-containing protein [Verrucomicrobiaceae bacterium]
MASFLLKSEGETPFSTHPGLLKLHSASTASRLYDPSPAIQNHMKLIPHTFTALLLGTALAGAATTSVNTGSLGAAANGTNSDGVTLSANSPLAAPGDLSGSYGGGSTATPVNTTIPYNAAVNPSAASPFTIEFWVNPNQDTNNGWAPVFNRVSASPRSGWTFFQRGSAGGGWNLALYNGDGSSVGKQITGGGSAFAVGAWTHVAGVWDGADLSLYINGVNSGSASSGTGYNASTSAVLSVGSYANGDNSFLGGLVDETAFYGQALTAAQILGHYNAASSTTAGTYSGLVQADGALVYLQNLAPVPEPAATSLAALGLLAAANRRRRS